MRRLAALILTTALVLQNSPLVYAVNVRVSLPQGGMTVGGAAGGAIGQKTGSLQLDTLVPGSLTLGSVLPGTQSFSASVNTRPGAQKTVAASVAVETPQEKGALAEFPANVTRGPPAIIPDSGTRTRTPLRTGLHAPRGMRTEEGFFATLKKRVSNFVGKHWDVPVEEILDNNDVLLLGESHSSRSSVQTLQRLVPRLKAAGVRRIGLEGLKHPHQKSVDKYLRGETEEFPAEAFQFSPGRFEEYRKLVETAKEYGLEIKALGRPLIEWAEQIGRHAARNQGTSKESYGMNLAEQVNRADNYYEKGFNEAVAEVVLKERNIDMAGRLSEGLAEGEKAVALLGDAHLDHPEELSYGLFGLAVEDYGTLANELENLLLKTFSVTLSAGVFAERGGMQAEWMMNNPLYRLFAELLPEDPVAYLPTSERTGVFHLGGAKGLPVFGYAAASAVTVSGMEAGVRDKTPDKKPIGVLAGMIAGSIAAVFIPFLWGVVPIHFGIFMAVPIFLLAAGTAAILLPVKSAIAGWKALKWAWRLSPWKKFALGLGVGAAAPFVPVIYKAYIALSPAWMLVAPGIALITGIRIWKLYEWWQKKRGGNRGPPKSRQKITLKRLTIGMVAGIILSLGAFTFQEQLVPPIHYAVGNFSEEQAYSYRLLPSEFKQKVIARMRSTASGRELIEEFRDAAGTVRLPPFYFSHTETPHYISAFDAIFLKIEDHVDLASVDFDKYIAVEDDTLFHEINHARQARRSIFTPGHFHGASWESEAESFARQTIYIFERWMQDPSRDKRAGMKEWNLEHFAMDIDAYLRSSLTEYGDIGHLPKAAPFHEWLARFKAAEYPRMRAEAMLILADRMMTQYRTPLPSMAIPKYEKALEFAQSAGAENVAEKAQEGIEKAKALQAERQAKSQNR